MRSELNIKYGDVRNHFKTKQNHKTNNYNDDDDEDCGKVDSKSKLSNEHDKLTFDLEDFCSLTCTIQRELVTIFARIWSIAT